MVEQKRLMGYGHFSGNPDKKIDQNVVDYPPIISVS